MRKLLEILETALPPVTMGRAKDVDRNMLQTRLMALSARNSAYFKLAVAMLVVAYLAVLGLAWQQRSGMAAAPALCAAAALSWWALALWREKANADLLLAFATEFPEEVLNSLIVTGAKAVAANIGRTPATLPLGSPPGDVGLPKGSAKGL